MTHRRASTPPSSGARLRNSPDFNASSSKRCHLTPTPTVTSRIGKLRYPILGPSIATSSTTFLISNDAYAYACTQPLPFRRKPLAYPTRRAPSLYQCRVLLRRQRKALNKTRQTIPQNRPSTPPTPPFQNYLQALNPRRSITPQWLRDERFCPRIFYWDRLARTPTWIKLELMSRSEMWAWRREQEMVRRMEKEVWEGRALVAVGGSVQGIEGALDLGESDCKVKEEEGKGCRLQ